MPANDRRDLIRCLKVNNQKFRCCVWLKRLTQDRYRRSIPLWVEGEQVQLRINPHPPPQAKGEIIRASYRKLINAKTIWRNHRTWFPCSTNITRRTASCCQHNLYQVLATNYCSSCLGSHGVYGAGHYEQYRTCIFHSVLPIWQLQYTWLCPRGCLR